MNRVFADTSFFVALVSRRDMYNEEARKLGQEHRGLVVTTQWVLVEVANFFAGSPQRAMGSEFLAALLEDRELEIYSATAESFVLGWELYRQRADKKWSLTDCISFSTMHELGLRQALTNDHHFEQAGFEILIK